VGVSPALESDSLAKKGVTYQCGDGIDSNGDGTIDYPNDETCRSADDDSETDVGEPFTCNDGYDNDLDGRTDWPDDPGCKFFDDPDETGGKYPH
jgi:hypothetical protein